MTTWSEYIKSGTISKTVEDPIWAANFDVDHRWSLTALTQKYAFHTNDHNDVLRRVFFGFLPSAQQTSEIAAERLDVPMVDHGWYLTKQAVQSDVIQNYLDSDPATIIEQLLGGANSGNVTGIGEYALRSNPDWSAIQKTFQWTTKTPKWQAIQEMSKYTGYVFHVLWSAESDPSIFAKAYFVKDTEIDDGYMGLPASVTITNPDDNLISLNSNASAADRYNEIECLGYDPDTLTYYKYILQSTQLAAGQECPITYHYQDLSGYMDTMNKTSTKAQSLFDDLSTVVWTYNAVFERRYDLQLYQKIKFVGYSLVAEVDMRITGIQYNLGVLNHTVTIQFSPISTLLIANPELIQRSMETNIISEERHVATSEIKQRVPTVSAATIQDVSGNMVQVNMDAETNKTIWVPLL